MVTRKFMAGGELWGVEDPGEPGDSLHTLDDWTAWYKEPKTAFFSLEKYRAKSFGFLVEEKCYLKRRIVFEGYNDEPSSSNSTDLES